MIPQPALRLLYLCGGGLALGLALLGIALPLLPTTPFLLLAAFCFARSSTVMHARLLAHPRLGPLIQDWERERAIRPPAKRMATLLIALTGGLTLALAPMPAWAKFALLATFAGVLAFIWTRPEGGLPLQEPEGP